MSGTLSVTDIRVGAIYRFGVSRGLGRSCLASLLVERAGFSEDSAKQLAGLWMTTAPYRALAARAQ